MEKPKIWPLATLKPLNRSSPNFAQVIVFRISPQCKILTRSDQSFFLPIRVKYHSSGSAIRLSFFFVLQRGYSRGPYTDLHAKYVKRRGSASAQLGCAFWGLETMIVSRIEFLSAIWLFLKLLYKLCNFCRTNVLIFNSHLVNKHYSL